MEARGLEDTGAFALAAQKYASLAESERDASLADRAAQARIRCLVRSGQKNLAMAAIDERFYGLRGGYGASLEGRLIAADEQLQYLRLLPAGDSRYLSHARTLQGLVENYGRQIPSAQRLFLMDQMRALPVRSALHPFPTYGAERMAERVLAEDRAVRGDAGLQLSGIADIWKMPSRDGTVIGLYRTATIQTAMRRFLDRQISPLDPVVTLTPPGQAPPVRGQWIAAGTRLPGWQISMAATKAWASGAGAQRQIASYLWIGFLTIAMAGAGDSGGPDAAPPDADRAKMNWRRRFLLVEALSRP